VPYAYPTGLYGCQFVVFVQCAQHIYYGQKRGYWCGLHKDEWQERDIIFNEYAYRDLILQYLVEMTEDINNDVEEAEERKAIG